MLAQLILRILPSARLRCRLRQNAFVRGIIRLLFGGERSVPVPHSPYRLYVDGSRNLGFMAHGFSGCEQEERALVSRIVSRLQPMTIWDIGANIGFWSIFLSTLVPRCSIRCYEPDPLNQKYLLLNRDRNGIGNWTVRPVVLSDRKGTSSFVTDVTTGSTGRIALGKTFGGDIQV